MKTTNQQPTTVGTSPKWKQPIISTGCVLLASLLMSVNIKSFVRAGNLIPGGFTGLSLLLQRTAETFFGISLPYSVINIALNAIPAIIGFRMIGKKFTSYTVLMIVLNSFLVDLIPVTPITYDPLLVSVFWRDFERNSNLDCFVRKSFQRWNGFYCGLSFLQIA